MEQCKACKNNNVPQEVCNNMCEKKGNRCTECGEPFIIGNGICVACEMKIMRDNE